MKNTKGPNLTHAIRMPGGTLPAGPLLQTDPDKNHICLGSHPPELFLRSPGTGPFKEARHGNVRTFASDQNFTVQYQVAG
jgi:hypothetical protein